MTDLSKRRILPLTLLLCLGAAGCGGEDKSSDEPTYTLDVVAADEGTGWKFGQDDVPAIQDTGSVASEDVGAAPTSDANPAADTAGPADGAADGATAADGAAANDAGPAPDTGPQLIKSCFGHCGIFLEDNPCHCHHDCGKEGNCCADFSQVCGCSTKKDCDDGAFCTIDSCISGLCKQIPLPPSKCCEVSADCTGGDKCNVPTCIEGSCQILPKDCDDGVACTVDVCDAENGACSSSVHPTKCLVAGVCYDADAVEPGSDGCSLCQPKVAGTAFTAKVGSCFIDGKCYASGEAAGGQSACRVCDPAASGSAWSIKPGTCYIDGVCHQAGASSPTTPECALCNPAKSQTAWTGKSGTCAIDGKCYGDGDAAPGAAASCATCKPAASTSAFTVAAGSCLIDGACVKQGGAAKGSFGCKVCDAAKKADGWTVQQGKACTDDDACSVDTICHPDGTCQGKSKPDCCKSDADCKAAAIELEPCHVAFCVTVDGSCSSKLDPACCSLVNAKCCDATSKTWMPKGTKCADFPMSTSEYKCEGDKGYKRSLYRGCSGVDNACSELFPSAGQWTLYKTCATPKTCVLASKTLPPTCQ